MRGQIPGWKSNLYIQIFGNGVGTLLCGFQKVEHFVVGDRR